nr:MAG TPA: hypothetical protein [Caudoviricetes sp.]
MIEGKPLYTASFSTLCLRLAVLLLLFEKPFKSCQFTVLRRRF